MVGFLLLVEELEAVGFGLGWEVPALRRFSASSRKPLGCLPVLAFFVYGGGSLVAGGVAVERGSSVVPFGGIPGGL